MMQNKSNLGNSRPSPRRGSIMHSPQKEEQRMNFPIIGDSGYDEPAGRKHYQPKHSAIHKLIFNEVYDPEQSTLSSNQSYRHQKSLPGRRNYQESNPYFTPKLESKPLSHFNQYAEQAKSHHYAEQTKSHHLPSSQIKKQQSYHSKCTMDSIDLILNPFEKAPTYFKYEPMPDAQLNRILSPTFLNSVL